jgi:hypothetical protein
MRASRQQRRALGVDTDHGLAIEFESFPDITLAFQSLESLRKGIEVLNVRTEQERTLATVFVPDGKLGHFERLIEDYVSEKRDRRGRPRDNRPLLDTISMIRRATIRALWTDELEFFPTATNDPLWWEVWLPVRDGRGRLESSFRMLAAAQGMRLSDGNVEFPERTVVLLEASVEQLGQSLLTLNNIAELRRPKETAEFFGGLSFSEEREWLDSLLRTARFAQPGEDVPHVCLLDTGVNNGHGLIAAALDEEDLHTVDPNWGVADQQGHGTNLAGASLIGNLADALALAQPVVVGHRLESVKLLPHSGANQGGPQLHGYLTAEAVAKAEISDPERRRIYTMAVTAGDYRERGQSTAWSATIDRLASDAEDSGSDPRLLVISAGNVDENSEWLDYPDSNETHSIHDPGQAWNALTVGAYTEFVRVTDDRRQDAQAVAPEGGLSPFSTTSVLWDHAIAPLKPDVVLEGGNALKDMYGAFTAESVSMLTTHHEPTRRLFTHFVATSAATALASRMAAQIMQA